MKQKKNRYENGYLPKIQYHNERLQEALNREVIDIDEVERYASSLNYFVARQKEVYGRLEQLYS
jgi:hypothetical protein